MNKTLLKELCTIDGISGREHAVREYILDKLNGSSAPKEVTVDALGNVLVHLYGKNKATATVLFDAHMDEVGFMITNINDDGSLCFSTVGGIENEALFGRRVRVGNINGVIGGKPVHQCSAEEKNTVPKAEDMAIDIGATDKHEAEALVAIGQGGTFVSPLCELSNDLFFAKAVDDRVGCAVLLSLAEKQPERDVWLSFSVQEEIGCRGAKVVGESIKPQVAIAIDATTAADIADSTEKTCVCRVGGGPVVSFADRATLYDEELYMRIRSLAEDANIPTQTKTRIAGGNNAAALQRSHTGVKMAAVSLPCRYIHTASCTAAWRDAEALESLILLLAERLTL